MATARVPNIIEVCTEMPRLPTDVNSRSYNRKHQAEFEAAMHFFPNPAEWYAVATAINEVIWKPHYCGGKCLCGALPFWLTLGLFSCPLCYVGCTLKRNVNADIAKLPEVQQLQARGISLE